MTALEEFFGSAAGLSAWVITRLTTDWQRERDQFARRSLKDVDYVYVYADGIHFNVRLEEAKLCALVIVGVRSDGTKELVYICDGRRECTESWADVLRGLKRRGMAAAALAVGDGALGFWGALPRPPGDRPPALLGAQDGQRHERLAQVGPAGGPGCAEGSVALMSYNLTDSCQLGLEGLIGSDDIVESIGDLAGEAGPVDGHAGAEITLLDLSEDSQEDVCVDTVATV